MPLGPSAEFDLAIPIQITYLRKKAKGIDKYSHARIRLREIDSSMLHSKYVKRNIKVGLTKNAK